jgi:hypothetical protein
MGKLIGAIGVIGFVVLAIVMILFWPFAIIWAVNTVFALNIAYTFWTWLAVIVLTATFGKTTVSIKK